MSTRTRKQQKTYNTYLQNKPIDAVCEFCNLDNFKSSIVEQAKYFYVIKNRYPYSQWDDQGVAKHYMIIPKKHTDTISNFTKAESAEYIQLLGSYESRGFDIAARAPSSSRKSIGHQHTHLIKLDHKTKKFILFIRKPYVRIQK